MNMQKMYMVCQIFKANGYMLNMGIDVLHVSGVKENCLKWINDCKYPSNTYAIIEIEVPGE